MLSVLGDSSVLYPSACNLQPSLRFHCVKTAHASCVTRTPCLCCNFVAFITNRLAHTVSSVTHRLGICTSVGPPNKILKKCLLMPALCNTSILSVCRHIVGRQIQAQRRPHSHLPKGTHLTNPLKVTSRNSRRGINVEDVTLYLKALTKRK